MQVHVVTEANRALYADELTAMHRGRHQVFVEELGWSELSSPTGLERDAFDDEDAVYLIAVHRDEVCGSVRLLPTWRRCMITEVWPQFVQRPCALGEPDVWEWTRWCPGTAKSPRKLWRTRAALIVAALEFAEARQVREYATFCETKFLTQIEALGWRPQPLGLPGPAGGAMAVALSWRVRPFLLEETRAQLRVEGQASVELASSPALAAARLVPAGARL
jgi:N-acyl-L-homoserine lactone synthetase